MEEKTEVKTYSIDMKCDSCGAGYMRPTGLVLDVAPPLYPHECNCGAHTNYKVRYPYLNTERIANVSARE